MRGGRGREGGGRGGGSRGEKLAALKRYNKYLDDVIGENNGVTDISEIINKSLF